MKRTQIKRKTPLKSKKGIKTAVRKKNLTTGLLGGKKGHIRKKLPSLKTLRDRNDKKLTPIMKLLLPECESCGQPTQVAHHWIEKSRSSFLRYKITNLIALCNSCHTKIHNKFGNSVVGGFDVAERIVNRRGRDWKEKLDKEAHLLVKTDRAYYEDNYSQLCAFEETVKRC